MARASKKVLDAVQTADFRRRRFQWSPSGERILFIHEPQGDNAGDPAEVWVVNRDGTDPKKVVQGDAARWMPPSTEDIVCDECALDIRP